MKLLFLICIFLHGSRSESIIFRKWTLRNDNGSILIRNLSSPVDVFSGLYDNSIIEWPLKGFNDVRYRWIGNENWTFSSEPFPVNGSESFVLYLSGLDIQPLVFINNVAVFISKSEFTSDFIEIKNSIFKKTNNVVKLLFYSQMLLANYSAENMKYRVPPDCWPNEFHGECHINLLRKTQASFGWDWGPAIPTVGIRGHVELYRTHKVLAKIKSVKLLTKFNANCTMQSAWVEVSAFVLAANTKSTICAHVRLPDLYSPDKNCTDHYKMGIIKFTFLLNMNLSTIKLWWPYEMGTPVLYKLESSITHTNDTLDTRLQYVGFRHITLNQTTLPHNTGRYFGFYINCRSVFLKGTNWVPRTYLTKDWNNDSHVEYLLKSVKMANLNSIRLWGGGKPEIERFYFVADILGLMIWHDLMFACSLYPDDPDFLATVQTETSEIVSNLQSHPSILVWSGNNEIEVLIAQGWYNTTKMDTNHINRYYNLFGKTIKKIVTKEDPFTPYIISSPSNGVESEKTKGVAKDPQSPFYGDCHFYLYDGDLWNESSYPITRMTTEFGFQSFPNIDTWRHLITSDEDFEINGTLMNHIQHHPDGNTQLMNSIFHYFTKLYPSHQAKNDEKYKWFSYLSQINQAIILKIHINKLRSNQCVLSQEGRGLTRGAMYWQLNDNWIAPTWSTIDYLGQWKLAHYYVKHSFSPERINMVVSNNLVTATLILPDHMNATDYEIEITSRNIHEKTSSSLTGIIRFFVNTKSFDCNVKVIFSSKIENFLMKLNCTDRRKCLFSVNLLKEKSIVCQDSLMLVYPKNMDFHPEMIKDKISYKVMPNKPDYSICSITLRNKYIHIYTSLTTSSLGMFSNNGMHLIHDVTTIQFYPWYYKSAIFFNCSDLSINITSLNGLYA